MAPPQSKKSKPNSFKSLNPLGQPINNKIIIKDQTELELEESVFGKSSRSIWDDLDNNYAQDDDNKFDQDDSEDEVQEETGLERLRDENLFFIDTPIASTSTSTSAFPPSDDSSSDSDSSPKTPKAQIIKSKNLRKAAWYDPADEELTVSLKDVTRLRKLRVNPGEDLIGGLEYEGRLRRQFEKMHPAPSWAAEARRKILKKRARATRMGDAYGSDGNSNSNDEDSTDDEEEVDNLFRSTMGRNKQLRKGLLKAGEIDIDRVRDANQVEASSGKIVSLGFHPTAQVIFAATSDRRLRLFQIDGTINPLLQTLHVPDLPITTAAFHPSGSSILLTGSRPFFISYDLQTGALLRSPRGLLTGGLGGSDRSATGSMGGMERFKFSPLGDILAVGGRRGYVHLVDWSSSSSSGGNGNGGQVIGEVKMNVAVKGIAWQKEGKELITLGEDSEVYVWDVGMRKCIGRWRDEGGFGACGVENSREGRYTAVASTTGIVNVYDNFDPTSAYNSTTTPLGSERKSIRAIGNLTTSVSSMTFNHDSQLLAIASKVNKDQLKLVHLPTATVFANWPTQNTPLHHVTAVEFSKKSEFLAIGNAKGKVLLYTVKHYSGK